MPTKPKPSSRILEAVHESARDLHNAGFIDMRSMQRYDALCLAAIPAYSSASIRALRDRHKLSHKLFNLTDRGHAEVVRIVIEMPPPAAPKPREARRTKVVPLIQHKHPRGGVQDFQ